MTMAPQGISGSLSDYAHNALGLGQSQSIGQYLVPDRTERAMRVVEALIEKLQIGQDVDAAKFAELVRLAAGLL